MFVIDRWELNDEILDIICQVFPVDVDRFRVNVSRIEFWALLIPNGW